MVSLRRLAFLLLILFDFTPSLMAQHASPVDDEDSFVIDLLWNQASRLPRTDRKVIGVALGGGGARGLAHIGVLKVLQEESISIDRLAGASVGALIGALFSAGISTHELESMSKEVGWETLTNYSRYSLMRLLVMQTGLSSERMQEYLERKMGDIHFDELKIPFACPATDLKTGERVVFREGPVALAARASATIPGLFEPVLFRHRYLVDGGLVSNLPTDLLTFLGAELIIGVDVTSDFSGTDPKGVLGAMNQAIYIQSEALSQKDRARADVLVRPDLGNITAMDIHRGAECIDAGILAARRAIPLIKRTIIDRSWDAIVHQANP